MAGEADDDLTPEQTEGFKAGEKKTLEEYQKLDWHHSLCIMSNRPSLRPSIAETRRSSIVGTRCSSIVGTRNSPIVAPRCPSVAGTRLQSLRSSKERASGQSLRPSGMGTSRSFNPRILEPVLITSKAPSVALAQLPETYIDAVGIKNYHKLTGQLSTQPEVMIPSHAYVGHSYPPERLQLSSHAYSGSLAACKSAVCLPSHCYVKAIGGPTEPKDHFWPTINYINERFDIVTQTMLHRAYVALLDSEAGNVPARDENDESLKRYKESLGLTSGNTIEDPNDKRLAIIQSLGLEVAGRPDIIIDLSAPGALDQLKKKSFVIKEGCEFRMKVKFRVQRQILSGLSYVQVVRRAGIPQKSSEMIGSYTPNTTDRPFYEKKFAAETAPSGMMMRGKYSAKSNFVDDDGNKHLQFEWSFEVKKEWE